MGNTVEYAGHSHFAMAFETPNEGAAERGLYGSAPTVGIATAEVGVGTAFGAFGGGVGAGVAGAELMHNVMEAYHEAKYGRELEEERESANLVAKGCAKDSKDYDECATCVAEANGLKRSEEIYSTELRDNVLAEAATGVVGGAVVAGVGCLIAGAFTFGIGLLVCAIAGAIGGLVGSVPDWLWTTSSTKKR